MRDAKNTNRGRKPCRAGQEMRVVGIHFNPGPDAQDRLRRIFTLLVKHVNGESSLSSNEDATLEAPESEVSDEEETS